jgi:DNA repair protein RadA/Sms
MEERIEAPELPAAKAAVRPPSPFQSEPQKLADIRLEAGHRMEVPLTEFSRVLGGGIVPGSLVLLGGDPGIGKSTLLLSVAGMVANGHGRVLYISGEESLQQIKMRAERLGISADNLFLVTETSVNAMFTHIEALRPLLVIVDSIQTCVLDSSNSAAGSVTQVRNSAARFQELAKSSGVTVFLVGHVTKTGTIAGPRVLEHIVDTVLYLEGDQFHRFRLLRSVKNRFGATSEIGVFEMEADGMQEVPNPSEAFLAERQVNAAGSAIAVTLEGTRPILVEVQALTSATAFAQPRRTANGVDYNRLLLVTAVLSKRVKVKLFDKDIFANVIGGLQINEPASDMALAAAIVSSSRDRPIYADIAFIGEIGLSGELRAVSQLNVRLREATKLGFKRCIVPRLQGSRLKEQPDGLILIPCRTVNEALEQALIPA